MNRKKVNKKSLKQKGGVAYTFNNSCRVGGLPERVALSSCPLAGPLDSCYIKQQYGQSCTKQLGGKRNNKNKTKINKSNKSKRRNNKKEKKQKSLKNSKRKTKTKKNKKTN